MTDDTFRLNTLDAATLPLHTLRQQYAEAVALFPSHPGHAFGFLQAIVEVLFAKCEREQDRPVNPETRDDRPGSPPSRVGKAQPPPLRTGTAGPAGARALANYTREVDKLGLGPWQPHVANVIPIRPSILNRSAATGSNPDRSA